MDLEASLAEAIQWSEQRRFDEAHALLAALTAAHPDSPEVFITTGNVFWMEDRPEEAANAFRRAVELAPQSEIASRELFLCLWMQDQRSAARSEANRFLSKAESPAYRALLHKLDGKHFDFEGAGSTASAEKRQLAAIVLSFYPALAVPLTLFLLQSLVDFVLICGPSCLQWAAAMLYARTGSRNAGRAAVVLGCLSTAWFGFALCAGLGGSSGGYGPPPFFEVVLVLILLGFTLTAVGTASIIFMESE